MRFGALALIAAMTAAGGCASSAKYVERKADSGIVAVPDNSDGWPNNNRRAALELIEKHVGPGYEIVDERTVPTRARTSSLPDTNETLNPRNQAFPAKRPIGPAATVHHDATQYQITYRKREGTYRPEPFISDPNMVQTMYPAAGTAPNVQPVGGPISAFNRNTVKPASGGADCNH